MKLPELKPPTPLDLPVKCFMGLKEKWLVSICLWKEAECRNVNLGKFASKGLFI